MPPWCCAWMLSHSHPSAMAMELLHQQTREGYDAILKSSLPGMWESPYCWWFSRCGHGVCQIDKHIQSLIPMKRRTRWCLKFTSTLGYCVENQPGSVAQRVCFQRHWSVWSVNDLFDHPPVPTVPSAEGQGEKAWPQPRESEEKHDILVSLWKASQEAPGRTPCANPSPSFYRKIVSVLRGLNIAFIKQLFFHLLCCLQRWITVSWKL